MFSDHKRMKLEVTTETHLRNPQISGEKKATRSQITHGSWIQREVRREIAKGLELNENETRHIVTYGTQLKQFERNIYNFKCLY